MTDKIVTSGRSKFSGMNANTEFRLYQAEKFVDRVEEIISINKWNERYEFGSCCDEKSSNDYQIAIKKAFLEACCADCGHSPAGRIDDSEDKE